MIKAKGNKRHLNTAPISEKMSDKKPRSHHSFLDRLSLSHSDVETSRAKPMDVLKNSIRLDLENLLNTRLKRQNSLARFPEVESSVLNYGLPDFSKVHFDDPEQCKSFAQRIQWVIDTFEPRLSSVNVDVLPVENQFERILHLRITAVLNISNEHLPVVLQSRVKSVDRRVAFHEVAYG